jgi:molybdenum cofactor cytidylyltransferase
MTRVGTIVLAAGQSSRFRAGGGPDVTKLVAKLDGKPIVRRVAEAALASKARPVVVVTGYARNSVEGALAGLDVELAFNPKFASGRIEPRLIDALIDAFLARKDVFAAVPSREGRRGNPVLLGRGLFEAAMRLEGDEGARRLIDALNATDLVEVGAPNTGVTFDIDTPEDLAAARGFRIGDG